MMRLVALVSCAAFVGATRVRMTAESQKVEASALGACVDINTATYLELKGTGLFTRGLALRIIMARACPYKDAAEMKAKLTQKGADDLWNKVNPLLQSGKLCVGCSKIGETKVGSTLDLLKTPISDLVSQIGMDEGLARALDKAMECKFTGFDDFKSRLEGPSYSGLDGGAVDFKADRAWFTSGTLCDFPTPAPAPVVQKDTKPIIKKLDQDSDDSIISEERTDDMPIDESGCVNVNTCTYLELKGSGLMSRGFALKILTARRCPFKDTAELTAKVGAAEGGDKVLAAFSPLLKSGKLCVGADCKGKDGALDVNIVPISDLVNKAGVSEELGRIANKAMDCKFKSVDDFVSRVEGPSYSGLDGGNVDFKVDRTWFTTGKLCRL